MNNEKPTIICISQETGQTTEVSMNYAIEKLDGYWISDHIEPMLITGQTLWNPYFMYVRKDFYNPQNPSNQ